MDVDMLHYPCFCQPVCSNDRSVASLCVFVLCIYLFVLCYDNGFHQCDSASTGWLFVFLEDLKMRTETSNRGGFDELLMERVNNQVLSKI